jgi:estrone sulfotransferase
MNSLYKRASNYVKTLTSIALGRRPAGRGVTVFPNDVFVVSYLRSGSTWSRFLLGNLVHENQTVTFANLNRFVPSVVAVPDRKLRKLPRVIKSHECFDPRYPRVIYLVRDPRDVAVSLYHYSIKTRHYQDDFPLDEFVRGFVAGKTVEYADRLGSWEDHVLSWIRMRQGRETFLLIRYEDLLATPEKEMAKIAAHLRIEASPERIRRAVELSSAAEMRSMEKKQWKQFNATKGSRPDIPFVREAKSGGWRKQLSPASVRAIEEAWGPTMQLLGYELSTAQNGKPEPQSVSATY